MRMEVLAAVVVAVVQTLTCPALLLVLLQSLQFTTVLVVFGPLGVFRQSIPDMIKAIGQHRPWKSNPSSELYLVYFIISQS